MKSSALHPVFISMMRIQDDFAKFQIYVLPRVEWEEDLSKKISSGVSGYRNKEATRFFWAKPLVL